MCKKDSLATKSNSNYKGSLFSFFLACVCLLCSCTYIGEERTASPLFVPRRIVPRDTNDGGRVLFYRGQESRST